MPPDYVFHVRNANPEDMRALLATLAVRPGLATIAEIVEEAAIGGRYIHDRQRLEALSTARDLGLVESDTNALTRDGKALWNIQCGKSELFSDIIHGLSYGLWRPSQPNRHCFSWTYRMVCQSLWLRSDSQSVVTRRALASEIQSHARLQFGRPDIALSPKSIGGAWLWLTELVPAVLDTQGIHFRRRSFSSPELVLLGVAHLYRQQETEYGANVLLTDDNRESLCQLCLMEPANLDRVLDYTVAQFGFLEQGLGGGWGRYLRLQHAPTLEDLV